MEGNHAQMKPTLQFRACYMSMRIREPTSRSKSAKAQEKTHFRQSQKQTQRSEGQMSSLTHLTFGEHPHANTGSPQGVHRPKMGPDGLRKGPVEPLGRLTPFLGRQAPSSTCGLPVLACGCSPKVMWVKLDIWPSDPCVCFWLCRKCVFSWA